MQAIDKQKLLIHASQSRELFGLGLDRVPHALLLCGAPGLGKLQFAQQLAQVLICERIEHSESGPVSCGSCPSCQMFVADTHPDLRTISPENDDDDSEASGNDIAGKLAEPNAVPVAKAKAKKKGNATIKIAAIRAVEDFVFVGSHRQGRRVVVITDAEAMNPVAANSLLKILEEPPATVYFILITSKPDRLLRTLVSRCRQLSFNTPSALEAREVLKSLEVPHRSDALLSLAGGAPFQVARWHESGLVDVLEALLQTLQRPGTYPIALAERWDALLKKDSSLRMDLLVEAVQRWTLSHAIKARQQLTQDVFLGWRALLQCRRSASHPLNQLLFLEELASHALRAVGATMSPQGGTR